ncbi:hypothetical protein MGYG_01544 [Nannizzia gypsea CBS 118893]|uniref:Uncharacterized protein n=1 Tax=Arthroderma gypseum (strain ATCC MYA-4604 / CBS 118893) TaxID=535722 RepID=E5R1I1_ARTGP|nr:hypothetical protein MGYG_01544 [Nannizzia gypsea CBS 118893]EFQ98517.1 hypothetical protein MGYG_01544 [Nannizzia gypsea CBS 118893]
MAKTSSHESRRHGQNALLISEQGKIGKYPIHATGHQGSVMHVCTQGTIDNIAHWTKISEHGNMGLAGGKGGHSNIRQTGRRPSSRIILGGCVPRNSVINASGNHDIVQA